MKQFWYTITIILFLALRVEAQDNGHGVVVHTDPRLSVLLKKKRVIMQASVAKPPVRKVMDTRIAGNPVHQGDEPAPVAAVIPKPVAETTHNIPDATTHTVVRPPVYIREKEGRVIYTGKGFRVQIYSGNDREKAIMIKTEFMRRFPGTRTYLTYVSPSFRVKVGNYRSRNDASGMYREARGIYSPCVIVPDIITINTK